MDIMDDNNLPSATPPSSSPPAEPSFSSPEPSVAADRPISGPPPLSSEPSSPPPLPDERPLSEPPSVSDQPSVPIPKPPLSKQPPQLNQEPPIEESLPPAKESSEPPLPPPPSPNKILLVLSAIFLITAGSFLAFFLTSKQKGKFILQKRAETVCHTGGCEDRTPGWSTCDSNGTRWGCDQDCNRWVATAGIGSSQYTDPWCEGTTKKECLPHNPDTSDGVSSQPDHPDCGGGPSGPCAGKERRSYCSGVGDWDGNVGVLNCTLERQTYTCQKNHSFFTTKATCDQATNTNEYEAYFGLVVEPGQSVTCSHYAPLNQQGKKCSIAQVDIRNNATLLDGDCWDTHKECHQCEEATPTPTPTKTPTPTSTPPPPEGCDEQCSLQNAAVVCQAGLYCKPVSSTSGVCRNPACPEETDCQCPPPTPTPTPTSTSTPTPTPTNTPGPSPTPTPTSITVVCSSLTAFKEGSSPPSLANLKVGDTIRFVITPSSGTGSVQNAAVRLFKNGNKVSDLFAGAYPGSKWTATYIIPSGGEGNYEAFGLIKVGGQWK